MGTCKAGGKVKRKRPFKMKIKGIRRKSPNQPNKHRLVPAKLRGFHEKSIQMNTSIPGVHERYKIDGNGTVRRIKEEVKE